MKSSQIAQIAGEALKRFLDVLAAVAAVVVFAGLVYGIYVSTPPAQKLVDQAQEAQSNELKGLQLLDRTKACDEKRDAVACREVGEPVPKREVRR